MLGDGDRAGELFSLLNPINHASTRAGIHRYKVEPYVVCADVYSAESHVGRGGWTWYTGSAGWMQRAAIEAILGLRLEGDVLCLDPRIPKAWPGFEIVLRHGTSRYEINVRNPHQSGQGIETAVMDGKTVLERPLRLALMDDGGTHRLSVELAATKPDVTETPAAA
jgi:cyclic beta-1,2-glucan synthetase